MSRTPVDDDLLREVLDQVSDALEDVDVHADPELLLGGLREALEALGDGKVPVRVRLLDGGLDRSKSKPRPTQRPALRVAEPLDDDDSLDGHAEALDLDLEEESTGRVRVRVIESHAERSRLSEEGQIRLAAAGRQVLSCAPAGRAYRVACERGELRIDVDGYVLPPLTAGQCVDVEGMLIVATTGAERGASGRYARVGVSSSGTGS
jgi:hypothetical protein